MYVANFLSLITAFYRFISVIKCNRLNGFSKKMQSKGSAKNYACITQQMHHKCTYISLNATSTSHTYNYNKQHHILALVYLSIQLYTDFNKQIYIRSYIHKKS